MSYKIILTMLISFLFLNILYSRPPEYATDGLILFEQTKGNKYKLNLLSFNKKLTQISSIPILENISFFEVKKSGTIFYIADITNEEEKTNRLKAKKLGIDLVYIKNLPKIKQTFCPPSFYVKGEIIYYLAEIKNKSYLSSLNISTGKHRLFTDKLYHSIGLFSLSPDQKKLAFYSFKRSIMHIDLLFIDTSTIKNVTPSSHSIMPTLPLRVPPVWDKYSQKFYYMSMTHGKIEFGLYSSRINSKEESYITNGVWPEGLSSRNKLFITTSNTEKPVVKILNLQDRSEKILLENAGNAKISVSERYISYIYPGNTSKRCRLYVYDLLTKKKLFLLEKSLRPNQYWWVELKLDK